MKHSIAYIIISILSIGSLCAQYHYGIKAGLNYTNNVVNQQSTIYDSKYKAGIHFGVFASADVTEKANLQTGLLYSSKGYKYTETVDLEGGNLNLNYITLPILVGYKISETLLANIGPEMGLLLSANSKFGSDKIDVSNTWDNKFDIGIAAGLELTASDNILLGLRYTHGLSSVIRNAYYSDIDGNLTGERAKFQNRSLQLTLGYLLK